MSIEQLIAKIDTIESPLRIAVLIDGDNAQPNIIGNIFEETARFGDAIVRRVYGNFMGPYLSSWRGVCEQYAIKPIHQFHFSSGKNSTDSALIIDAMDLLYTGRYDGFVIVSSDSDFTGLATRIREQGLMVLGFGQNHTPIAFRNACNKFFLTEFLGYTLNPDNVDTPCTEAEKSPSPEKTEISSEFLLRALSQASDESGWAPLHRYGTVLLYLRPDFDSRRYGFGKLSKYVKSRTDLFVVEDRFHPNGAFAGIYLKAVEQSPVVCPEI